MAIFVIICAVVGLGIFFGVRFFDNSKKAEKASVSQLIEEKNDQVVSTVNNEREVVESNVEVESAPLIENKAPMNEDKPTVALVEKKNATPKVAETVSTKASSNDGKIVSKLVSWGFAKSSGRNIKAIILHTSYNAIGGDVFDFGKVVQEWKDAGVAPHYAIDRDGVIYQLVADGNVAWHAGVSKLPDGTTDVNGVSIGVEIINSQDAKFTDAQYAAINSLISILKKKYEIKYVLGHGEIAPGRKTDPWGIQWNRVNR